MALRAGQNYFVINHQVVNTYHLTKPANTELCRFRVTAYVHDTDPPLLPNIIIITSECSGLKLIWLNSIS